MGLWAHQEHIQYSQCTKTVLLYRIFSVFYTPVGSVYLNERKKKDWKILYLYVCMLFCWIYFLFIIIIHVGIIKRFNCFFN